LGDHRRHTQVRVARADQRRADRRAGGHLRPRPGPLRAAHGCEPVRAPGRGPAGAPTPFAGSTTSEALASLRAAMTSTEHGPPEPVDETMALPRRLVIGGSPSHYFASTLREVPFPDLSIDHYAALVVELELR